MSSSKANGDSNCICPLYAYRRYDKMNPVKAEPDHYPKNIKTVYRRDYTPKKTGTEAERADFKPYRTAIKSRPTGDNYVTTNRKDYTPKAARSTTPIRMPEHSYRRDVPLNDKSEYKDMTQDAGDRFVYTPVKNAREKPKPTSNFGEHTVYQDDYTPKKNSTAKTAVPADDDLIFRGRDNKRAGPMEDRTIYMKDYTPKPQGSKVGQGKDAFRESNWDVRPRMFDDLTVYKKDYVGPHQTHCQCPAHLEDGHSRASGSHHN